MRKMKPKAEKAKGLATAQAKERKLLLVLAGQAGATHVEGWAYMRKRWPVERHMKDEGKATRFGENCPSIRTRICDGLGFLGIERNEARNAETAGVISADGSRATVRVIRTDEELMIARSVCRALGLGMASEKRNSDHATKYISRLDPFSAGGVPHNPR
jgi:Acetokinase family